MKFAGRSIPSRLHLFPNPSYRFALRVFACSAIYLRGIPRTSKYPCRQLVLLFLACLFGCSAPAPEESTPSPAGSSYPRFTDVAVPLGLTRSHTGGGPEKGYIVEAKGGGGALLDFDSDGDLDIYWVNGATLDAPGAGAGNALYRNDAFKAFVDVAASKGVAGKGWGMGAISADYDSDGDADLYVTTLQDNLLYRNDGNSDFVDVASLAGVAASGWSTGAAFADYDLDGDLDLYVAHYVEFDPAEISPLGTQWKGVDAFIGPLGLRPLPDVLFRNEGDGTFTDVSRKTGIAQVEPGYGFGVLFADYDLDGDPDLYVANDSSPNFLFRNEGDGTFADVSLGGNASYGEMGNAQAGMGVAWGDYDGDRYPDILVTHFEDDYNTLYRNNGSGGFADVSFAAGLGRASLTYVSFGAGFLDFDNDGDLDLLTANGHVYPQIDQGGSGATYAQPDHLFENTGEGRFELLLPQPGDSLGTARVSRGSCIGDLDNDGDLDIFVINLNDRPSLLRNDVGDRRNWLGVQLVGAAGNRDAIGARLELFAGGTIQVRDVICGSSFLCSEDRRAHFGLGSSTRIDSLRIRWPSGSVQRFADLPPNSYLIVEEERATWSLASP